MIGKEQEREIKIAWDEERHWDPMEELSYLYCYSFFKTESNLGFLNIV